MANKSLFKSLLGKLVRPADAVNEAGGTAYALPPQQALAQYAATGCLNHTFYASAEEQLANVLDLAGQVEPEFVARAAIYARERGYMKDLPALLCAALAQRAPALLAQTFGRVIDDGRMLRNFVQIIRSGVVGRKSLGTLPKRLIRDWLAARSDEQLFRASVGADPSLADIVKMVHPKPESAQRAALFGYLIGRAPAMEALPDLVQAYEPFKASGAGPAPDVPFQMLTSLPLTPAHWKTIAENAGWQMTRMNLNTFARHGVFDDAALTERIADRLRDPAKVASARVFPYQLMVAYAQAGGLVPACVVEALQDAMELAIANVPTIAGGVCVFPDVSGSMHSPITGVRAGATTAVRCVDVAALIAATMLRRNPGATVVPFATEAMPDVRLNPRDSVMTNAQKLASLPSGGTNCSAALAEVNRRNADAGLLVYVSDNESWLDSPRHGTFGGSRTATMEQWTLYKRRNPRAKLVCIDLQPYGTTQALERDDILNIGGFSDRVFELIGQFAAGELAPAHWVGVIESVAL